METIRLTNDNGTEAVARAAAVLRARGVVLYPTDTLYGLGADAFSDEAVAKIYAIKGRDEKKPIHAVVANVEMAERYAEVNGLARMLAQRFLPGPLTLVLKKNPRFDSGIGRGMETIGIRVPANAFCLALARAFDAPYTTTSANLAGGRTPRELGEILAQLGERALVIDLALDAGVLLERKPSTVVDVSSGQARILREGAIPSAEISGV